METKQPLKENSTNQPTEHQSDKSLAKYVVFIHFPELKNDCWHSSS